MSTYVVDLVTPCETVVIGKRWPCYVHHMFVVTAGDDASPDDAAATALAAVPVEPVDNAIGPTKVMRVIPVEPGVTEVLPFGDYLSNMGGLDKCQPYGELVTE